MNSRLGRVLKAADLRTTDHVVPWNATTSRGTRTAPREETAELLAEQAQGRSPVREPQVEVVRTDGEIEAIQVSCACGRVHRLDLIEPSKGTPNEPRHAGAETQEEGAKS